MEVLEDDVPFQRGDLERVSAVSFRGSEMFEGSILFLKCTGHGGY